jgi:hypothetical protein
MKLTEATKLIILVTLILFQVSLEHKFEIDGKYSYYRFKKVGSNLHITVKLQIQKIVLMNAPNSLSFIPQVDRHRSVDVEFASDYSEVLFTATELGPYFERLDLKNMAHEPMYVPFENHKNEKETNLDLKAHERHGIDGNKINISVDSDNRVFISFSKNVKQLNLKKNIGFLKVDFLILTLYNQTRLEQSKLRKLKEKLISFKENNLGTYTQTSGKHNKGDFGLHLNTKKLLRNK